MIYCTRCVYPETSAIKLTFDEKGVCSGCRVAEEKKNIDWDARQEELHEILEKYRSKDSSNYDCIIPVSGGKDSHFQTYIIKEVYGLKPLLVTFNHTFNTKAGIRNLTNLVTKFGVDHIRFTLNPQLVKKLARQSLKKMGDMCWHCHAGIYTYPVQIAVKFKIPLIIWGESGQLDLAGTFSHYDKVEMRKEVRKNLGLRGFDAEDMIGEGITKENLRWAVYPSDEEIEAVGVRGIYLGNYLPWNAKRQTEMLIEKYGFETAREERTYNTYENVECHHCGGAHDYLRWLKFGYGRATDHASQDIRLGRMTREEGIEMVEKYDSKRPADLDMFLEFAEMTEEEFIECINPMRDKGAWKQDEKGNWVLADPISNHRNDPGVEEVRLTITEDHNYILTSNEEKKEGGYVTM